MTHDSDAPLVRRGGRPKGPRALLDVGRTDPMTPEDIAAIAGISVGGVMSRYNRGIRGAELLRPEMTAKKPAREKLPRVREAPVFDDEYFDVGAGHMMNVAEIAKATGLRRSMVAQRIKAGRSGADLLTPEPAHRAARWRPLSHATGMPLAGGTTQATFDQACTDMAVQSALTGRAITSLRGARAGGDWEAASQDFEIAMAGVRKMEAAIRVIRDSLNADNDRRNGRT